jgi:uncharacterized delta-60 repeat protein
VKRGRPELGQVATAIRGGVALVGAMVVSVVFSAGAQAAPGDLDPTFSGDGKQTTDIGLGVSGAAATVLQPDGKIVAVGMDRAHDSAALARYNPDGSLDTSFSGDGKKLTTGYSATGVALQSNDKIVAVGGGFALARYNPDGSLDTSFSGDGKQTTPFAYSSVAAVAIQDDGKIVVVGGTGGEGQFKDFALARYNPNGSLDRTFSGDGKQRTDMGGSDAAQAVVVQDDGKIVVTGAYGGSGRFALARYNPNGNLDPSFSGDGKTVTTFGSGGARGVALQADGKIVAVGGTGGSREARDFALARYNTNGSLDTSFSHNGLQNTNIEDVDAANGVAIQDDGKIVAVGHADLLTVDSPDFPVSGDFALARYNADGSLDVSFSDNGKQTTDFFGVRFDSAAAVALEDDEEIVAVGVAHRGGGTDFGLARYATDGTLDSGFSGDGRQTTGFGGIGDRANGVAIQDDGKIVAVGHAGGEGSDAPGDFGLARYNPDGSLDHSFSGDGRQTTDFGGRDEAQDVALQNDGKIVVVGQGGSDDFAIARYNTDGSLDSSFSGDGMLTTYVGDSAVAYAVVIQSDGKILAAGQGGGVFGFALARYNTDGSPDTSFSGDGIQTMTGAGFEWATGVALQPGGKIVVAGVKSAGTYDNHDFGLIRYLPGGAIDMSFSGNGMQSTDFGGNDFANGMTIGPDGKIVVVGHVDSDWSQVTGDLGVARYNPNGSLDRTFSGDGKQTTDFGGVDGGNAVAVQGNGKIVAAGFAGPTGFNFALARYTPTGTLDATFSGDGKQTTSFGVADSDFGPFGGAADVALQSDGKIVTVGMGREPSHTEDFAVARYLGD